MLRVSEKIVLGRLVPMRVSMKPLKYFPRALNMKEMAIFTNEGDMRTPISTPRCIDA
jgi:hypothetical protein